MGSKVASGHAVVLGASIAGLLAARVLADHYQRVIIVERDVLPTGAQPRRGVPHGRHLHALQPGGRIVLDQLFEGFTAEAVDKGALSGDVLGRVRWVLGGNRLARRDIALPGIFSSRVFLETLIRERVLALPNVTVRERTDVLGLTDHAGRITAVRVLDRGTDRDHLSQQPGHADPAYARQDPAEGLRTAAELGAASESIEADLVVDATGRGSRTPGWLEGLGYPRPEAERVEIDVWYTTRMFRLREGAIGGDYAIPMTPTPTQSRSAVLALQENGTCLVTLVGRGEQPPTDPAGFEDYLGTLVYPDIRDAIQGAEPLGDGRRFRFPASVRHRYERLDRFPDRFLVLGDALCSFNPVYGQGMSVAAAEAGLLRDLLATGVPSARTWFRRAAKVVDTPWQVAVNADLADPNVPGRRTRIVRLVNGYLPKVQAAAAVDPSVAAALVRVMGMVDQPTALFAPGLLFRVLRHSRRARGTQTRPGSAGSVNNSAADGVPTTDTAANVTSLEGGVGGAGRRP